MSVLSHLEPQSVFGYFETISAIPRGSGHTGQISDYLVSFASEHGLECLRDESGNVIIRKEGTAGLEEAPAVMLQGHMDMICEKDPGCVIDMQRDPIRLHVEDGIISAEGTTLGGDDGIALAYMLAILASDDIPHPPLEAVMTVDEEIGMIGAAALDTSPLRARYLLNIDSEKEGHLLAGCAGGVTATCHIPVRTSEYAGAEALIRVEGGLGGHSGVEIDQGRANANRELGLALKRFGETVDFRIVRISGGKKDNAIPAQSEAVLIVEPDVRVPDMIALVRGMSEDLAEKYSAADPGLRITLSVDPDIRTMRGTDAFDRETTRRIVEALTQLPCGLQKMSDDIPGLVQTSLNLGILETAEDEVRMSFGVRSSVGREKDELIARMEEIMNRLGGSLTLAGDYPAWEYRKDSPLRDLMVDAFKQQYGHEPAVEIIHAGVECGLFAGKMPGLDCVSFGPDMLDIHTPRERMDAASARRTWEYLLTVLERIPELPDDRTL